MFRKKKDEEKRGEEDFESGQNPDNEVRREDVDVFGRRFGADPFSNMFSDFSGIERMMNDLMKNMFSGEQRIEPGKPFVYGFSMKSGPDGKPVISEFGNVKPQAKARVTDAREPLVDVVEKENEIIVIAELPGVSKEEIDLEAASDRLIIDVENSEKKFYKEVVLPCDVKEDAIDASYKNGILEVKLKRVSESRPKTKKISIK
jgi:HSP20 family protein